MKRFGTHSEFKRKQCLYMCPVRKVHMPPRGALMDMLAAGMREATDEVPTLRKAGRSSYLSCTALIGTVSFLGSPWRAPCTPSCSSGPSRLPLAKASAAVILVVQGGMADEPQKGTALGVFSCQAPFSHIRQDLKLEASIRAASSCSWRSCPLPSCCLFTAGLVKTLQAPSRLRQIGVLIESQPMGTLRSRQAS